MKKEIFYLIILMLFKQFYISAQSVKFNDTLRPFDNGSGAYSLENIVVSDSFYYASGEFKSSNGQYSFLLQLNEHGGLIKKKLYVDSGFAFALYPYNTMILKDNQLLMCGQIWGDSMDGTLGFVTAIDKNTLDTLWTKRYLHPDTLIAQTAQDVFSVLTSIKNTPDGNYILTGNYNKDCITGNVRSFLMKIDSVGNVLWRKIYTNHYTFFDIELAPDSGYYVPCGYNGTNALLVVKFDKYGMYQWEVSATTNSMAGYPVEMALDEDNNAIVGYKYLYDVVNFYTAVSVSKVDLTNKNIVWEKIYYTYQTFDCISMNQAMGIECLPNGNIIVSGTTERFGYEAVILKLNSNGDSLWSNTYDFGPDPWSCQLNDLIITEDGGFMGVGFFSDQNGPGWTAWMFKTDSTGYLSYMNYVPIAIGIKIFPNPTTDYVNIDLSDFKDRKNLKLYIFNNQQQLLKTFDITDEQQLRVDLRDYAAGFYFLRLMDGSEVVGVGKVVRN